MADWRPIATVPAHRPVRLRKFPCPAEMRTQEWVAIFSVPADEVARLKITDATHWMDLSPTSPFHQPGD